MRYGARGSLTWRSACMRHHSVEADFFAGGGSVFLEIGTRVTLPSLALTVGTTT